MGEGYRMRRRDVGIFAGFPLNRDKLAGEKGCYNLPFHVWPGILLLRAEGCVQAPEPPQASSRSAVLGRLWPRLGKGSARRNVKAGKTRRLPANRASEPQQPVPPSPEPWEPGGALSLTSSLKPLGRRTRASGRHGLSFSGRAQDWSPTCPAGQSCRLRHTQQAVHLRKTGRSRAASRL